MNGSKQTPKRFWFQFRLSSLLIVVTVLAASLAWVGRQIQDAQSEQVAAAWVRTSGGTVNHEGVSGVLWDGYEPTWWRALLDKRIGAAVRHVDLGDTDVSDLSPLANLKNLKGLWLSNSQVSDLSPLADLTNLEGLYLVNTQVSDLSPLEGLTNLKCLWLSDTEVADVSPLMKLADLNQVCLSDRQVSDHQLQELKSVLPDCDFLLVADDD